MKRCSCNISHLIFQLENELRCLLKRKCGCGRKEKKDCCDKCDISDKNCK